MVPKSSVAYQQNHRNIKNPKRCRWQRHVKILNNPIKLERLRSLKVAPSPVFGCTFSGGLPEHSYVKWCHRPLCIYSHGRSILHLRIKRGDVWSSLILWFVRNMFTHKLRNWQRTSSQKLDWENCTQRCTLSASALALLALLALLTLLKLPAPSSKRVDYWVCTSEVFWNEMHTAYPFSVSWVLLLYHALPACQAASRLAPALGLQKLQQVRSGASESR